jgi:Ca-activated chloride channel family protein
MIVFDASGSMAATDVPSPFATRIDLVQQALRRMLPIVARTRKLGLVVYGPGKHRNVCQNADLRFLPRPNAAREILSQVARLAPAGQTPLTNGVRIAASALSVSANSGAIVLLTDGEETCGGDPCFLGHMLHKIAPGITVHIIGYKLQTSNAEPPALAAKCLADETGGYTVNANTLDELIKALEKTLGCPAVASIP